MSKNSEVRLAEAINFFRDTPVPRLAPTMRRELLAALWNWKNNTPLATKTRVSTLMSQKNAPRRPAQRLGRQYRRTAILLQCAMVEPIPMNWQLLAGAVNLSAFTPSEVYDNAAQAAADIHYSSAVMGARLIAHLRSDPGGFLQTYRLTVDGPGDSGRTPYYVYMFQQTVRFTVNVIPGAASTPVIKVGVTPWLTAVVNGLPTIAGTRSADEPAVDLMFTTQFTGCTFCFQKNLANTEVVAAHIDPGADPRGGRLPFAPPVRQGVAPPPAPPLGYAATGDMIRAQLINPICAFRNGNNGVFRAHGRNMAAAADATDSYGPMASAVIIMGVRVGGTWQIWRQFQTGGMNFTAARIDQ